MNSFFGLTWSLQLFRAAAGQPALGIIPLFMGHALCFPLSPWLVAVPVVLFRRDLSQRNMSGPHTCRANRQAADEILAHPDIVLRPVCVDHVGPLLRDYFASRSQLVTARLHRSIEPQHRYGVNAESRS